MPNERRSGSSQQASDFGSLASPSPHSGGDKGSNNNNHNNTDYIVEGVRVSPRFPLTRGPCMPCQSCCKMADFEWSPRWLNPLKR
ncbi:uncharacterized protein ColSpa_03250 [Colletotrichum spaethianum]|uniref:Uncharacterized protein n=1 Tax=Colletotrichum spaethianum TaxID=700344 RepID=A0AA37P7B7_9PEZI|nr:uncharacterized protein ColSpa_03250 [Colletotrichum spaethianum]GKT43069.1 hypothetical protein ColSpa_03250 [Colletotrichum spaethianum]